MRIAIGGQVDPASDQKDADEQRLANELSRFMSAQLGRVLANAGRLDAAFWSNEDRLMLGLFTSNLSRMAHTGADVAVQQTPLKGLGDVSGDIMGWLNKYAFDLISGINGTTRAAVERAVGAFVSESSYTLRQLRETLQPAFGISRSTTIAVTEVTRAYAVGQDLMQSRIEQEGIPTIKVWRTLEDEKVCPICAPLDFLAESPQGGFNPFGGFGIPDPPAHPNCRCFTVLEPLRTP